MKKASILIALAITIAGCGGHAKPPAELEAGLDSADPAVRRDSADGLRDGGKVPADAVPKLLIAAKTEKDSDALGAMLVTLGISGAPAAHDTICLHDRDPDAHVAKAADHAIGLWLDRNPDQGGCRMSGVQEVPASEGPSVVPTKPITPRSWKNDMK